MAQAAVRFDAVWKKFRRGERHDSLRDLIPALARRAWTRPRGDQLQRQEFWALEDVSFEVGGGEALGIIGPNGAGKSTTLKLLTRILKPTRGACEVRGRVGALIEVAAGFHPDLTGRENIFMQGAIMGMRRTEIARKLDAIIEFAGVGAFVDTPVKRYSSGMNARLGFSIAAHLDPDVLIIDEILSVGDMTFQQRCLERMAEFKRRGVTIVFVSHNLQAVTMLCDRVLHLNSGVKAIGPTQPVIESYVATTATTSRTATGAEVEIVSAHVGRRDGTPGPVAPGTPLTARVQYRTRAAIDDLTFGFLVYRSTDRLLVYDANWHGEELGISRVDAGDEFACDFTFATNLTRGQYHVECHVFHNPTHRFVARLCPTGTFVVSESRTYSGIADLDVRASRVAPAAPRAVEEGRLPQLAALGELM
jgi:lipopolysaccharide transport system ATP-binding protein